MPRISFMTAIWMSVIAILVIFEFLQFTGLVRVSSIAANFYLFVFSLVTIAILAVIGAIFLGITIAHRLLERGDFTPFELEMLSMKEQINEIQ
ncbi:MAG: hypothetical protein KIY12_09980, partial [Thermoplasmata archaeon]|nr:hypothetical protein [Candidatus Sysuiplasma superficiale]